MPSNVGLWIDHANAIVLTLSGDKEEWNLIESGTSKQLRRQGDSPMRGSYEPQSVLAPDARQRLLTQQLNAYYRLIIERLRNAERIWICGPGEAKIELKRHIDAARLGDRVIGLESADRMTDRQLAARVRSRLAS